MIKVILIAFISLSLGYFLGSNQQSIKIEEKIVETKCEANPTPSNLSSDCSKDKELIKEAFLAFLSAVGIRMLNPEQKTVDNFFEKPEQYKEEFFQLSQKIELPQSEPVLRRRTRTNIIPSIKKTEIDLPKKRDAFKKGQGLEKPMTFYESSHYVKSIKLLRHINGNYEGVLFAFNASEGERKWNDGWREEVILEINMFEKNNGDVDGDYFLQLIKAGDAYSTMRGNGGNKNIRVSQDGKDLILEVSPGSFFHFKGLQVKRGQYYKDGSYVGDVRLNKK